MKKMHKSQLIYIESNGNIHTSKCYYLDLDNKAFIKIMDLNISAIYSPKEFKEVLMKFENDKSIKKYNFRPFGKSGINQNDLTETLPYEYLEILQMSAMMSGIKLIGITNRDL